MTIGRVWHLVLSLLSKCRRVEANKNEYAYQAMRQEQVRVLGNLGHKGGGVLAQGELLRLNMLFMR